jgi:zinc/manganese transport system substrate-binding protein
MSRSKPIAAALWLLTVLMLAACGGGTGTAPAATQPPQSSGGSDGGKLNVVATFSVLGDMVQNVGGDLVALRTLVGPGGDAHAFQPTPADGVALAEADLVIENGVAFETWLDNLYDASGSQARRVAVAEGLDLIKGEEGDEHAEADEHAEEQEAHGEYDPHVWHDVANAIKMVEAIRDALAAADPANAAGYKANADAYLAELNTLDGFIVEQTATLPEERRKLVTTHDTFAYFARRYGYEIVGTALGATTAADPAAGEIVALVEQIKAAGVPAIFAENIQNPRLMEQIASEAGVALGPPLYTDALGEPGSDGATYVQMMRSNVTTLVTTLGK